MMLNQGLICFIRAKIIYSFEGNKFLSLTADSFPHYDYYNKKNDTVID